MAPLLARLPPTLRGSPRALLPRRHADVHEAGRGGDVIAVVLAGPEDVEEAIGDVGPAPVTPVPVVVVVGGAPVPVVPPPVADRRDRGREAGTPERFGVEDKLGARGR